MRSINLESARNLNGGATFYMCPWRDYGSTSFWKVYRHTLLHACIDVLRSPISICL